MNMGSIGKSGKDIIRGLLDVCYAKGKYNQISEDDLLDRIDGYYVLAPSWKRIERRDAGHSKPDASELSPAISAGDRPPDSQAR